MDRARTVVEETSVVKTEDTGVWKQARTDNVRASLDQGGNPARGKEVFDGGDCASCHASPGQSDRQRLGGGLGPYALQAAIAACPRARPPSLGGTWR